MLRIERLEQGLSRAECGIEFNEDKSSLEGSMPNHGWMEATIADGAIEVIRVSGDSREVRWRGVYEAKGRKWVVREAPKESHTANTAYHDPLTDIIIFSAIL